MKANELHYIDDGFKRIGKKIEGNSINPIIGFDCKDMKYTIIITRSVMFQFSPRSSAQFSVE